MTLQPSTPVKARLLLLSALRAGTLHLLETAGHDFHGNQWTSGGGSGPEPSTAALAVRPGQHVDISKINNRRFLFHPNGTIVLGRERSPGRELTDAERAHIADNPESSHAEVLDNVLSADHQAAPSEYDSYLLRGYVRNDQGRTVVSVETQPVNAVTASDNVDKLVERLVIHGARPDTVISVLSWHGDVDLTIKKGWPDLLKKRGRVRAAEDAGHDFHGNQWVAYHGTTAENAEKILKEGLKPDSHGDVWTTTNLIEAKTYARAAGPNSVILNVRVPAHDTTRYDEQKSFGSKTLRVYKEPLKSEYISLHSAHVSGGPYGEWKALAAERRHAEGAGHDFHGNQWTAGNAQLGKDLSQKTWLHGTGVASKGELKDPVFLTTSHEGADWFAQNRGDSPNVVPFKVDVKNPLPLNSYEDALKLKDVLEAGGLKPELENDRHGWRWHLDVPGPYEGDNPIDVVYSPQAREAICKAGYDAVYVSHDPLSNSAIDALVPLDAKKQLTGKYSGRALEDSGHEFHGNQWTSGDGQSSPIESSIGQIAHDGSIESVDFTEGDVEGQLSGPLSQADMHEHKGTFARMAAPSQRFRVQTVKDLPGMRVQWLSEPSADDYFAVQDHYERKGVKIVDQFVSSTGLRSLDPRKLRSAEDAGHDFHGNQWTESSGSATYEPRDQAAAVESYTNGISYHINTALRAGRPPDDAEEHLEVKHNVPRLDSLMTPSSKAMIVYRISDDAQSLALRQGQQFRDHGYTSTTKTQAALKDIAGDIDLGDEHVTLAIHVPKDTPTLDVNRIIGNAHDYAHQHEVILARGTKFRVTSRAGNVVHLAVYR